MNESDACWEDSHTPGSVEALMLSGVTSLLFTLPFGLTGQI